MAEKTSIIFGIGKPILNEFQFEVGPDARGSRGEWIAYIYTHTNNALVLFTHVNIIMLMIGRKAHKKNLLIKKIKEKGAFFVSQGAGHEI